MSTLVQDDSSLSLHHAPGLGSLLEEVGHHGVLAVNGLDGGHLHHPDTLCWTSVHGGQELKDGIVELTLI